MAGWLNEAGLGKYVENFSRCGVDEAAFKKLLMQDYPKVGVEDLGDKQKLFRLIKSVNSDKYSTGGAVGEGADSLLDEPEDLLDLAEETDLLGDAHQFQPGQQLMPTSPDMSGTNFGHAWSDEPQPTSPLAGPIARQDLAAAAAALGPPPRIRVVVRKRPQNRKEVQKNEHDIVSMECQTGHLTVHEPKIKVDMTKYVEQQEFAFDDVLHEDIDQDTVYMTTVYPLVQSIFSKAKATCFAYGQTGSGKTYTMQPLPIRAAQDMIDILQYPEHSHMRLWVSYFEIYGGKVFDLLNKRKKLCMREDGRGNVCIVGLVEHEVSSMADVQGLIESGSLVRSTGSTGANSESSRSHSILQMSVKELPKEASRAQQIAARHTGEQPKSGRLVGKFSFIDLAGSERGADTYDNDRQTRIEGAEINKSLLALKECIRALDHDAKHVPFRGSKLTEVLRDSFVGNCFLVMIANISPSSGSCEHTLNTLRYADRVKELRKNPNGTVAAPFSYLASLTQHAQGAAPQPQPQRTVALSTPQRRESLSVESGPGPAERLRQLSSSVSESRAPTTPKATREPRRLSTSTNSLQVERSTLDRRPSERRASINAAEVRTETRPSQAERGDSRRQSLAETRSALAREPESPPPPRAPVEAPSADSELDNAHAELVNSILEESDNLVAEHRTHIEDTMELVRKEVNLVAEMDQPGGAVDVYVQELSEILELKVQHIANIQERIGRFQRLLREEEILSAQIGRSG